MREQFVTYNIALKLKKLGFNEPCIGIFDIKNNLRFIKNKTGHPGGSKNSDCQPNILSPLWQQVIDWFREKHSIHTHFYMLYDEVKWIVQLNGEVGEFIDGNWYCDTYFNAREKAILKAIELITERKDKCAK